MIRTRASWALLAACALGSCGDSAPPAPEATGPRRTLDLSGAGWQLWLDRAATWEQDELFAPPVELAKVPVNEPTGGWAALAAAKSDRWDVSVPATVEQYAWDALAAERRAAGEKAADDPLSGDYVGVSWWWREFEVPAEMLAPGADGPRHLELRFGAARLRAEVFVNRRLVARDDVGNTPFACDVTAALQAGRNELAVRVTDPCGNFDWNDLEAQRWGAHTVPASHGFGGLTGGVQLVATGPVRLADAWIENTAQPERIIAHVEIENAGAQTASVAWTVWLRTLDGREVPSKAMHVARSCPPGRTVDMEPLLVSKPALWSPASPTLHVARFELTTAATIGDASAMSLPRVDDAAETRFGFRSFTVDDTNGRAMFRLNGERIFLRSAISWGFWPTSGMVPTPELARRQVESAQALGLNMLNHHRTIAAPGLLDVQDELGLLAFEEPGGYGGKGGDELCRALAREKLLRMVRRDRGHPSLVIVNMINEASEPPTDAQKQDLLDAHALAPHLAMTYTSAWAKDGDDPLKLHVRPGEKEPRLAGWRDEHNAAGPGIWRDSFWNGPGEHRRRTENAAEIVFWGEEGAIASPPRLGAIVKDLDSAAPGWDGATYRDWAAKYEEFLDRKGLRKWYPTLDSVTQPLADVAFDYQARSFESVRLGDLTDGYVINGWEDEVVENHSGVVDLWRHVKGDAARIAAANAPVRLAVKLRSSVVAAGEWVSPSLQVPITVMADTFLIDETPRAGRFVLTLALRDKAGAALWSREAEVEVHGGDVFGEPLQTDLQVVAECHEGSHELVAELHELGADGRPGALVARGSDTLWVVGWRDQAMPVNGAVLEQGFALRNFLKHSGRPALPVFFDGLPAVDYVLVGDFDPEPREVVPAEALRSVGVPPEADVVGDVPSVPGLAVEYFRGDACDRSNLVDRSERAPGAIDFDWSREPPISSLDRTNYCVRWEGLILATESGKYTIHVQSDDGVRLWLGSSLVVPPNIDNWTEHEPTWDRCEIELQAGETRLLRLEYRQSDGGAKIQLCWTPPSAKAKSKAFVTNLLKRARQDGTRLCFLVNADRWAAALAEAGAVKYRGRMDHGKYWLGGGFLLREHQLFNGLPSSGAMSGPWQEFVQYGANRFGLRLDGEECLAFSVSDHQHEPATSVGIVPCGKGKILLSTLDVVRSLNAGFTAEPLPGTDTPAPRFAPGPADVTRRYVMNVLQWAGAK